MITLIGLATLFAAVWNAYQAHVSHKLNDHGRAVYRLLFAIFWLIAWSVTTFVSYAE